MKTFQQSNSHTLAAMFTTLATLLTLASALPTHALPAVQLVTFGQNTNYAVDSSLQNTNTENRHTLRIPLGTSLSSLEQRPLEVQSMQIIGVEGAALDDVECKVNIRFSSAGVTVRAKDGLKILDEKEKKPLQVTGLSCVLRPITRTKRYD